MMPQSSVAQRIERLIPQLQTTVLYSVGQSLFKEDRLMYAMHLVHGSHPEMFEKNEWEFFLGDLVSGACAYHDSTGTASQPVTTLLALHALEHHRLLCRSLTCLTPFLKASLNGLRPSKRRCSS